MDKIMRLKALFQDVYKESVLLDTTFEELLVSINSFKKERKMDLLLLDQEQSDWYFKSNIVAMTLYIELFSENINNLINKLPYFKDLGITLIHLMPLLKTRKGDNDGGYAVEDYRSINEHLGSIEDFTYMLNIYRENGIYICIDYVINHVAKEHEWAKKALEKNKEYQDMFIMYDNDEIPNRFNQTVPEVLPDKYPGNFTYYSEINKYVFTSFSEFQWDLNFKNPKVFLGMAENLLYLANLGVNMIRLDAIPFMWKELDTSCRNLPMIHKLIEMLNLIKNIVCPSVALLGEAIVEPHEIVKYFGTSHNPECEIMYNANLMVDIFNSFATRDTRLIAIDTNLHHIPNTGSWMNYVRCHDDIGWGFNEEAIENMGFSSYHHKQYLIEFYGNNFPNTFSSGEYYQINQANHDARTNGTLASLLGLEKAILENDKFKQETAIKRINLAHGLILFYRGFPILYSGDEIATLNNQEYKKDPIKANDGRWVHRPFFDWDRAKKRNVYGTKEYFVFQTLKKMIQIRKNNAFFDGRNLQFSLDVQNQAVFCLLRRYEDELIFGLFNFSEHPQIINLDTLRQNVSSFQYEDIINGRKIDINEHQIELSPYEYLWAFPKNKECE
ncbi:MAG: alpha-amylase family glycosyl hydrolase [Tenericutes bacterium]|nr:alpha-amylase family glycosyl hydrolase [Mycoplasmatota bacterium]